MTVEKRKQNIPGMAIAPYIPPSRGKGSGKKEKGREKKDAGRLRL